MSTSERNLQWLLAFLCFALAFPAHATRDPEFPPNTIVVLAKYDSNGNLMNAGKFAGKVDYICDGVDDQVEIQKAIDNVYNPPTNNDPDGAAFAGQGGTVLLVGGKFYISDTITIEKASALTIRGLHGRGANAGGSEHTVGYGGWADNDNNTALIWVGVDGGTMMQVHGCLNCNFQNFLLYGKNGEESNVAGKLMHVTWETDWASGGHHLE